MADSVLSAACFQDEDAAFAYVEAHLWPDGPVCPFCGEREKIGRLRGKTTRPGLRKCYACKKPFTVRIATIFESSHLPLRLWLQVIYLMCASKKGISIRQIQRMLKCSMKTAWFIGYRIRAAARILPLIVLAALAAPAFAAAQGVRCGEVPTGPYGFRVPEILPGISTSAWTHFFDIHWSQKEMAANSWFPLESVSAAATSVPAEPQLLEVRWLPTEHYKPLVVAGEKATDAYERAAELYRDNDYAGAIALFDKIVATASPYRAAAAYTAARAALYEGHLVDGFARIHRIVSDPAMHEFHLAAYHLIGTLANQTGAAPLVAARLAEISYLLKAPSVLLCRDEDLRNLVLQAQADLGRILETAFPTDRFDDSRWSPHTRQIIDTLALHDPFLDLVRTLAAPTPFHRSYAVNRGPDYGWIETFAPAEADFANKRDQAARDLAYSGGTALTDQARQQWLATKNLLWGYALAVRTDSPDDIPLLKDMLSTVTSLPQDAALAGPVLALHRQFIGQEARLLLMAGRMGDALEALDADQTWRSPFAMADLTTPPINDGIQSFILDGGVRYLIEKRDLDAARRWADAVQTMLGRSRPYRSRLEIGLALLLARDWNEFVDIDAKGWPSPTEGAALDLLPAQKLVSLSQRPGLPLAYRRALLSAGWVRLYMLGRWREFLDLVPLVRQDFPEFAADLDQIKAAWTDRTRRHLVTHLLLSAPGLSPRVLWARRAPRYNNPGTLQADEFSIDAYDPSDGNWWCPLNIGRAKVDFLGQFVVGPVEPNKARFFDPASLRGVSTWRFFGEAANAEEARLAAAADQIVAWHPLFKDVDFSELRQLATVESGPRQLSEEAVAWADRSSWFTRLLGLDDQLPETLHLAVRSTRYGCRLAGGHGAYSRSAYLALHTRFPASEWTKKTPFWFDRPGRSAAAGR